MYSGVKNKKVFEYFEALTKIPHGSGNMEAISDYCMEFAKAHSLEAYKDEACNVIIYKSASGGCETKEPIILQGHLDMVCQKDEGKEIDFEKDGLTIFRDGDFIKADGTTLGADNGIAVAMVLAILDDESLMHPPIEAVFTTDEEIGMVGALKLDFKKLHAKRMINIDSEDAKKVTVSCAGGSDFSVSIPLERTKAEGEAVRLCVKGLMGGHSGVEINSGRVNANVLMGRILAELKNALGIEIISIDGGDKGNAIPVSCSARLIVKDKNSFQKALDECKKAIENEIKERESGLVIEAEYSGRAEEEVVASDVAQKLIYILLRTPNGVVGMSSEIENLVETSLNLGIVKTEKDFMKMLYTLRSNKSHSLTELSQKLEEFFEIIPCEIAKSGHYPPWEYKKDSLLRDLYIKEYSQKIGYAPETESIHAGLECGVFASAIEDFDCISIGPELYDIHTTKERLSVSSTDSIYDIVVSLLGKL